LGWVEPVTAASKAAGIEWMTPFPPLWARQAEDGGEHEDQAMKPDDGVIPLSHFLFDRSIGVGKAEGGGKDGGWAYR
jgi:hypothetical protein